MTIENMKRVMWRLRSNCKEWLKDHNYVRRDDLWKAIAIELGTCKQTYYNNKAVLVKLGWIMPRKTRVVLTDKDLTEDYG